MKLDDNLKGLLKKLGTALHHAMADSEDVRNITRAIRDEGFNLFLVMEANIALEKKQNLEKDDGFLTRPKEHVSIKMSKFDEKFLADMRIGMDDEPTQIDPED